MQLSHHIPDQKIWPQLTIWKNGYNLLHFLFETNLQYPVRLINHQGLEVSIYKSLRVLEVIQESARSRNKEVDALD